jgi:hypothetical protein
MGFADGGYGGVGLIRGFGGSVGYNELIMCFGSGGYGGVGYAELKMGFGGDGYGGVGYTDFI